MVDGPPPKAASALLPAYRPLRGRYDELADERGHPREHWEQLVQLFERLGPAEIDERRRMAERLLIGEGASYTNDESDEASQAWRIDPVPLLWPRAEWTAVEAGLAQRARLLDALIADLYGPQRLLGEGVVPAELVYASSKFRWAAVAPTGAGRAPGPRLATYAADLVRDGQGRLVVLRDHTDSPGGPGFALVNRRVLSRLFADTYRDAPETLGPNVRANVEMAAAITLADRAWAHLEQTRIAKAFGAALERFDLLIAPTTPLSPFPWTELYAQRIDGQAMRNYYHWLALTYVVTLATNPALALPCGRDAQGMPFGLQLIGRLRGEAALLASAAALEQAFEASPELRRPRPDLERLRAPRPELKSIVTHPPLAGEGAAVAGGVNAV